MRDSFHILLLPGDGIGPEVIGAARTVMDVAAENLGIELSYEERRIGGVAIREEGEPVSDETIERAKASDAVLLGAVGHPDFDRGPVRPEAGLLKLRRTLGAFANLRPVAATPALLPASTLKEEVIEGVDFLIVRELTGGGTPWKGDLGGQGQRVGDEPAVASGCRGRGGGEPGRDARSRARGRRR